MTDRSGVINQQGIDNGRSAAGIVQDVVRDVQYIMRSEVRLAKAEVSEKVSQVAGAAGMYAGAAVAGLLGAMALAACMVAVLALWLPVWASALIVSLLFCGGALALFMMARARMKRFTPVPEKTVETLKDDVEWAKQRTR